MPRPGPEPIEAYVDASTRFAQAVRRGDLSAAVPACPGWSTYDVIVHLGNYHGWAATIVETGQRVPAHDDAPESKVAAEVADWYAGKAEDLAAVLRGVSPQTRCWNFTGTRLTGAFWARRQLHETTLHLVDLDQAAGRPSDLSPVLCADGVDEVLTTMLPLMRSRGRVAPLATPLIFRAVDHAMAWTLRADGDESAPAVARLKGLAALKSGGLGLFAVDASDAPNAVNGPAGLLWQLLWRRTGRSPEDGSPVLTHPELSYDGDTKAIHAFLESQLTPDPT